MLKNEQILVELFKLEAVKQLCKYLFNVVLTPGEEEIVRAVAFPKKKRTIICCVTRYGKSFCVSMGILLRILNNPKRKIALIAPTNEKTMIIRNYVSYFVANSLIFSDLLDIERKGIEKIKKEVSRKRMTWKNGCELRTLSAEGRGEQLMGFGADDAIVDEECDIDYEVYRSKITRMLGESKDSTYTGIGNPWHRDNQMWQHWINPDWNKIHIGYEQAIKEGRMSREFIEEQRMTLTDREFQVLYKAEFPDTAEDALIDWKWINRATMQKEPEEGELIAGGDIAEHGNDLTVITIGYYDKVLHKFRVIDIQSWGKTDLMITVGKILQLYDKHKFSKITIDATGIGAGVYGRLEELRKEGKMKCTVNAFKGGTSPNTDTAKQQFVNTKAEAYWHLRKLFEENKISIPSHRTLLDQLNKMKWELTSSHKIIIRDPGTKEGDTAEEKSPDFADSLCYFCWEQTRTPLVFSNLNEQKEKVKA